MTDTPKTTLAERAQDAVERRDHHQQPTARDALMGMRGEFARALPAHVTVDRWLRVAMTAVRKTPGLGECSRESFLSGMLQSAQLGLEVNDARGQSWMIPRRNGRTGQTEATWQLGYMGLVDLAGRGGITPEVRDVHANDTFSYSYGLARNIEHRPALGDRGPVVAYYAIAWRDGEPLGFEVASVTEMEAWRDRFAPTSKSGKVVGPWADHFDAMARKTVLRRCLRYLPLPVELASAVAADDRQVIDVDDVGLELPAPVRSAEPVDISDAQEITDGE